MGRLQETLLEFGRGFSYVGRQVHFDVEQLRYVVIELKIWKFKPVVDDRL